MTPLTTHATLLIVTVAPVSPVPVTVTISPALYIVEVGKVITLAPASTYVKVHVPSQTLS